MIVETAERVGPGPGQLRDRCCRAVGEMVVQALWRGQLHFQPAIYIPEPVERTVREWVECVPTCLRYKHKLVAFHHHPVLQAGYTEPQLPHPVLNVRWSGGDELQHGAHHAGRPHGDALLSLTQGTNTITIKLNR